MQRHKNEYNFKLYMVRAQVKVKQWGNSLGVIIPKDVAQQEGIVANDTVHLSIHKKRTLQEFYGRGKGLHKSVQTIKDEVRDEWVMK